MTYKSDGGRDDISGSKISFHAWKILAILSGIATMVLYAETMLVPAIPRLINDFGITAYLLGYFHHILSLELYLYQ